jgi:hypothetical protein
MTTNYNATRLSCLSIRQPFAWAIVAGHKPIENRTRRTHYRGMLGIHAAVRKKDLADSITLFDGLGVDVETELHFGQLLGVVEVVDCVLVSELPASLRSSPHAQGPYCWILKNPVSLKRPLPIVGRLGIFNVELPSPLGELLA